MLQRAVDQVSQLCRGGGQRGGDRSGHPGLRVFGWLSPVVQVEQVQQPEDAVTAVAEGAFAVDVELHRARPRGTHRERMGDGCQG